MAVLGMLRKRLILPMFVHSLNMHLKIWSPQSVTGKMKLQNIQHRAERFVIGRFGRTDSITDIISSLSWPTLEVRRNYLDTCHKSFKINLLGLLKIFFAHILVVLDQTHSPSKVSLVMLLLIATLYSHVQFADGTTSPQR